MIFFGGGVGVRRFFQYTDGGTQICSKHEGGSIFGQNSEKNNMYSINFKALL